MARSARPELHREDRRRRTYGPRPGRGDRRGCALAARRDDAGLMLLVDDLTLAKCGQALAPVLERLGGESGPVRHFAHDTQRMGAAVRAGWVAGELPVGDVRIVLEPAQRLHFEYTRKGARRELGRELGSKPSTIPKRGEVDVVHHH